MKYVVQIDNSHIRTITSDKKLKVGDIIPDEIWLGSLVKGGTITKIF